MWSRVMHWNASSEIRSRSVGNPLRVGESATAIIDDEHGTCRVRVSGAVPLGPDIPVTQSLSVSHCVVDRSSRHIIVERR